MYKDSLNKILPRVRFKVAATHARYEHGLVKHMSSYLLYFIDWIIVLPEPLELQYKEYAAYLLH